jgi:hypothetical protein
MTERCASCKKQVCTRPKYGAKVGGNRHCLSCANLTVNVPFRTRSQTPQKTATTGSYKQGKGKTRATSAPKERDGDDRDASQSSLTGDHGYTTETSSTSRGGHRK